MIAVVWAMAPAGWAQHASEPQPLVWVDDMDLLEGLAVDSGWWPSPDAIIAVRFAVTTTGGLSTMLEADSELMWTGVPDDPLLHRVVGRAAGGQVALDALLDISTDVKLDLAGVFTGTVALTDAQVELTDVATFDGLLLPGQPQTATVGYTGDAVPLTLRIDVITGVDLIVGVDVAPDLAAEVVGRTVTSDVLEQTLTQQAEGEWVELAPDPGAPGALGFASQWHGTVDGGLDVLLQPEVAVFTPLGTFDLLRFDLPLPLETIAAQRTMEPVFLVHPLPVLQGPPADIDLGEVLVGTLATAFIDIVNPGELGLVGDVELVGDTAFAAFPDQIAAQPDGRDGITVTFAPSAPGAFEASLALITNDPVRPIRTVRVIGLGVRPDPVAEADPDPDPIETSSTR